jgi:hypothetical protein
MRYAICMKRTTLMLPDTLDDRLRREARRRGVPIAEVTRQALEHELPEPSTNGGLSFFAIGKGDPADAAANSEQWVSKAMSRRHPPG